MQEQIRILRKWMQGGKPGPFGIELSPTLRCNLECDFCWRKPFRTMDYKTEFKNELTFEDYKRVVEEASKIGVREIKIIGGGEAFVREDILNIMALVKKKGMYGYVCTNGTLFNEKTIKKLVEIGWDYIKISFHGHEEIHNSLVGSTSAFNKIIRALKLFRRYKREYNKKTPFIEFGVVLVNKNFRNIDEIIRIAVENNVDAVFLEPVTVYSDYGKKLKLDKKQQEEFHALIKNYAALAGKLNLTNNFPDFFEKTFIESTNSMDKLILGNSGKVDFINSPCFEPWLRIGIRADGLVGPCGFFDESSNENVKTKNLVSIWHGDYFKKKREDMLNRNLPEYCKKCCTTLVSNNQKIRNELLK